MFNVHISTIISIPGNLNFVYTILKIHQDSASAHPKSSSQFWAFVMAVPHFWHQNLYLIPIAVIKNFTA